MHSSYTYRREKCSFLNNIFVSCGSATLVKFYITQAAPTWLIAEIYQFDRAKQEFSTKYNRPIYAIKCEHPLVIWTAENVENDQTGWFELLVVYSEVDQLGNPTVLRLATLDLISLEFCEVFHYHCSDSFHLESTDPMMGKFCDHTNHKYPTYSSVITFLLQKGPQLLIQHVYQSQNYIQWIKKNSMGEYHSHTLNLDFYAQSIGFSYDKLKLTLVMDHRTLHIQVSDLNYPQILLRMASDKSNFPPSSLFGKENFMDKRDVDSLMDKDSIDIGNSDEEQVETRSIYDLVTEAKITTSQYILAQIHSQFSRTRSTFYQDKQTMATLDSTAGRATNQQSTALDIKVKSPNDKKISPICLSPSSGMKNNVMSPLVGIYIHKPHLHHLTAGLLFRLSRMINHEPIEHILTHQFYDKIGSTQWLNVIYLSTQNVLYQILVLPETITTDVLHQEQITIEKFTGRYFLKDQVKLLKLVQMNCPYTNAILIHYIDGSFELVSGNVTMHNNKKSDLILLESFISIQNDQKISCPQILVDDFSKLGYDQVLFFVDKEQSIKLKNQLYFQYTIKQINFDANSKSNNEELDMWILVDWKVQDCESSKITTWREFTIIQTKLPPNEKLASIIHALRGRIESAQKNLKLLQRRIDQKRHFIKRASALVSSFASCSNHPTNSFSNDGFREVSIIDDSQGKTRQVDLFQADDHLIPLEYFSPVATSSVNNRDTKSASNGATSMRKNDHVDDKHLGSIMSKVPLQLPNLLSPSPLLPPNIVFATSFMSYHGDFHIQLHVENSINSTQIMIVQGLLLTIEDRLITCQNSPTINLPCGSTAVVEAWFDLNQLALDTNHIQVQTTLEYRYERDLHDHSHFRTLHAGYATPANPNHLKSPPVKHIHALSFHFSVLISLDHPSVIDSIEIMLQDRIGMYKQNFNKSSVRSPDFFSSNKDTNSITCRRYHVEDRWDTIGKTCQIHVIVLSRDHVKFNLHAENEQTMLQLLDIIQRNLPDGAKLSQNPLWSQNLNVCDRLFQAFKSELMVLENWRTHVQGLPENALKSAANNSLDPLRSLLEWKIKYAKAQIKTDLAYSELIVQAKLLTIRPVLICGRKIFSVQCLIQEIEQDLN